MSMFSTKEEVDNHVKKILSFRNQYNKDRQSLMISKWYFDVKAYTIAKYYIDEFIKVQESSQEALLLKAKIHESLKEYDLASGCYERLYDLFSEKNAIVKASELLLKSDNRNEVKIKKYINILEKLCPTDEIYIKLKKSLSPNAIFSYSFEEIVNLKSQIKLNANDDLKLRFLRILENQHGVVNSLEECQNLMDSYRIIENNEAVKIILAIFKKYFKPDQIQFKNHYCLILIALIFDRKVCEFDRKSYLFDLFNLLKNEKINDKNRVIFQILIYFLSTMSHCCVIKNNKLSIANIAISAAVRKGYSICSIFSNTDQIHFSPNISTWLRSQISLIRSISNHFVNYNTYFDEKYVITHKQCIATLVELIWDNSSNSDDVPEITDIINDNFNITDVKVKKSTIDEDLQCLTQHFANLKLIGWQFFCLNKFPNRNEFDYHLKSSLCDYINSIITKLFAKVPLEVVGNNKKAPENMCKIDLVVFLLGTLLTYQKSFNFTEYFSEYLPYPYEIWQELRIPDVIHKWWQGACDFLLLGKRNTSIGVLRDLLKSGLDSLQLVDNQMSEVMKLQLGRLSVNCARCFDCEKDSLMKRAISFYCSVIQPEKYPSSFKALPVSSTFATQGFVVNRHKSVSRGSQIESKSTFPGGIRVNELFDTDNVSDKMQIDWKFDAYLAVISWRLRVNQQQQSIIAMSVTEMEELERLIETAEEIRPKSAELLYEKSKFYAAKCRALQTRSVPGLKYNSSDYNRYLKLAQDYAHEAMVYAHQLPTEQQAHMQESIQTLLNLLATYHVGDEYSIMEFSCIGETCNSNKCFNQSIVSNDFFNQSSFSADQSIAIDNDKLEQLKYDVVGLSSSQEKIGSEMIFCLNQIDNLTKFVKDELSIVEKKRVTDDNILQNDMLSKLMSKIEDLSSDVNNLNRKIELFEFQSKLDQEELKYYKKDIDYLSEKVDKLTVENSSLKNKLTIANITGNIIPPEMNKIDNMINNYFQQCFNNASTEIQLKKIMQSKPQVNFTENIKTEPCLSTESDPIAKSNVSEPVELTQSGSDFFSKFNQNKWQCPTCSCMNDDKFTICPSCQTANTKLVKNHEKQTLNFDLDKCVLYKYECPTWVGVNNDESSKFSACQTPKPKSVKEESKIQSTFDLSKFNANKWECPTCACMNKDELKKCPACNTVNPKSVKEELKIQSTFDLSKFNTNKWECPTCACMNKDELKKCPACQTANPKSVKEEPKIQSTFDLSKFNANKWECPTCACMNNDELKKCPACNTANPKSVEEPKIQSTFDLSKCNANKWECPTCSCMNDNKEASCPSCSYTKPSMNSQLPSIANENNSIKFGNLTSATKSSGFVFGRSKQSNTTDNSQSFVFGTTKSAESSETEKFAVNFGVSKKFEETKELSKVTFGSSSANVLNNQEESNIDFNFGKSVTNIDLMNKWQCECTTANNADRTECIACDEKKNGRVVLQSNESDYDSDVIIVSEPYVTEEQKIRARALLLPDHFYAYENLSENESSDEGETPNESDSSYDEEVEENEEEREKSEDEKDQGESESRNEENETTFENNGFGVNFFSFNSKQNPFDFNCTTHTNIFGNTSSFNPQQNNTEENTEENNTTHTNVFGYTSSFNPQQNNTEENTEENLEDYDPEYKPIIDLPEKIEIVTGEENTECLFIERCKLFKWSNNNSWNERGVGEMKILISTSSDNKKSGRLVMRRDQVHKVCCNHAIVKNCPTFIDMENKTSVCWFANDFSEGTELVKEKFAIRYKSESQLNLFKDLIKDLQDQM